MLSATPAEPIDDARNSLRPAVKIRRKRILVVEDNLDTMRSLVNLLRDMGHVVEFAINGYAAVKSAPQFFPHFLLIDLGLPGIDGFEVCKRLKKEPALAETKFVAITAYAQEEYRQRAIEAGFDLYMVKPVSAQQFAELLEKD